MAEREPPDNWVQSAIEYRKARERSQGHGFRGKGFHEDQARHNGPNGEDHGEPVLMPIETLTASDWADEPVPVRSYLDGRSLMPQRNVILLSGDGGMGKSLLALQLAIACATGSKWLDMEVVAGGVLYLSAEDDVDELKIRVKEICAAEGIDQHDAYTLQIAPMAGLDATLAVENPKTRTLMVTELYRRLDLTLEASTPVLLILDNQADTYGGNESHRSQVKHFIGMLRRLALKHDCVVLLLSHPSLTGRSSGTGESGSTAWNNSVRCRMYLHKPDGADADEDDDRRILEVMKANYGKAGVRIGVKWANHRFVRDEGSNPFDMISVDDVDRVVVAISRGHWRVHEQAQDWGGYAVARVLDLDIGEGLPSASRSVEQNKFRDRVRVYLRTWVRNKRLFVVSGVGADRKPTSFYSVNEPKEEKP